MAVKQKLKVLVMAYACEPDKGSEPGVGWNWVKQIAKRHEVWVLTRANNRESIEHELDQNPVSNAHFVYVDLPRWMRFWKRGQRGIHLYYYLWQVAAYIKARDLNRQICFHLTHHVTFVCDWMPSSLSLLPVPFIWGPIGSQLAPEALKREIGWRGRRQERIKVFIRWFMRNLNPFFRLTLRRARIIIAVDSATALRVPAVGRQKTRIMTQNGVFFAELSTTQGMSISSDKLIVLSIGRFIYFKGFRLTIRSFARFVHQHPDARLVLIGGGTEYAKLQRLVLESSIEDKVEFHDWMSRADVLKFMQSADIFLFPSYEGGGMVVIEAMAAGKPVVCLAAGGPGEAVTDECGIRVKVEDIDQIIQDLSDALCRLAADPALRREMGAAAEERIREVYDWDRKGEQIERLYELVMSK